VQGPSTTESRPISTDTTQCQPSRRRAVERAGRSSGSAAARSKHTIRTSCRSWTHSQTVQVVPFLGAPCRVTCARGLQRSRTASTRPFAGEDEATCVDSAQLCSSVAVAGCVRCSSGGCGCDWGMAPPAVQRQPHVSTAASDTCITVQYSMLTDYVATCWMNQACVQHRYIHQSCKFTAAGPCACADCSPYLSRSS
jgi:hypothetical protein